MTRKIIAPFLWLFLLALLPCSVPFASAEPAPASAREITLRECVEAAIRSNIDFAVAREEREIARLAVPIEGAAFLPKFTGELSATRAVTPSTSTLTGALSLDQRLLKWNISASELLPVGLKLSADFENQMQEINYAYTRLSPEYSTALTFSATYPLLKNRGYEATTAPLFVAYVGAAAATRDWETKAMDIAAAARSSFLAFYAASQEVDVRRSGVTLAEKVLVQVDARIEGGATAASDRLPAEAAVLTRKEELLRAEAAARSAEYDLKNVMGVRSSGDWRERLVATSPGDPVLPPGEEDTFEEALKRRPELVAQEYRTRQIELQERLARQRTLPSLDLTASAGLSGIAGTPNPNPLLGQTSEAFRGTYVDSLNDTFSGRYYTWFMGIKTEVPWRFDREKAEWERAKAAVRQERFRVEALNAQIRLDVEKNRGELESAVARAETSRASVAAAQKKLEGEEQKLAVGRSTVYQVLQFQQDLSEARLAEVRAQVDGHIAQTRLRRALGTILDREGIVLK